MKFSTNHNNTIMNTSKNKVQLIGHLGAAPEVKTFENGNTLAKMNIATNETYKNAKGEEVSDTQWHRVTAWGKTAEIAGKYLTKGSQVLIDGRLAYREYTDKEGQRRFMTDVVVNEILMLDKKSVAEIVEPRT